MHRFTAEVSVKEENNSFIINASKNIVLDTEIYIIEIGLTVFRFIYQRILFPSDICETIFHEDIMVDIRYYMDIDSCIFSKEKPDDIELVKIMCESEPIVIKMYPLNKITVEIE